MVTTTVLGVNMFLDKLASAVSSLSFRSEISSGSIAVDSKDGLKVHKKGR